MERFLLTKGACLRQVTVADVLPVDAEAESAVAAPVEPPHAPHLQRMAEARRLRHERAVALHHEVHRLRTLGLDIAAIARAVGASRRTTYRYLGMPEPPDPKRGPRRRRRALDPYLPHLLRRWEDGCQNAQALWREVRAQGYLGSASCVARLAARWRRQQRAGERPNPLPPARRSLTIRQAVMLLVRPAERLTAAQRAARDRLCALDHGILAAAHVARAFGTLLRGRRVDQFDAWLEAAAACGVRELRGFAAGLTDDPAVRAGLTELWSNGQTEGQVNRLKLIKRQAYGRAGFELLRRRVLAS